MDYTLGKRIAARRKTLGLTQEQLAEKLGVTAQAVSKWENDQSCPDISVIPKLADIFGMTTDELLGRATMTQVHTPKQEEKKEDDDSGFHFQWNSGRRHCISCALWLIAVGVLYLVSTLLELDVGFWQITWQSAFLFLGLTMTLRRPSFTSLALLLCGGYFLFTSFADPGWELDGKIVWAVVLVLLGLSLLLGARRRSSPPFFRFSNKNTRVSYDQEEGRFHCGLAFSELYKQVEMPLLAGGEVDCSFGTLTLDLSGVRDVQDGCAIQANCSFGDIILKVPRRFQVQIVNSAAFSGTETVGHPDPDTDKSICLEASASFSHIRVEYI